MTKRKVGKQNFQFTFGGRKGLRVNASYSGSFYVDVGLPKVLNMFLYIIHMDMVLNSKVSLV
jgi:hypothetical protein